MFSYYSLAVATLMNLNRDEFLAAVIAENYWYIGRFLDLRDTGVNIQNMTVGWKEVGHHLYVKYSLASTLP